MWCLLRIVDQVVAFVKELHSEGLIARFCIDEFHNCSNTHAQFRQEYGCVCRAELSLSLLSRAGELNLKADFPDVPVTCCSATADTKMVLDCLGSLKMQSDVLFFQADMDRFNIHTHTEVRSPNFHAR